MSLTNIMAITKRWLATFLREQAEMSEKVELFRETISWRTES